MKNKKMIIALSLALILVATLFIGCTPKDDMENIIEMEELDEKDMPKEEGVIEMEALPLTLTMAELGQYNGKGGQPAYVAYDGIIYDVTGVDKWQSGSHGGNMAGTDITGILGGVSHGTAKLNGLPEVGIIVD